MSSRNRKGFEVIRTTSLAKAAFDLFMIEEKVRQQNPNLGQSEAIEALFARYEGGKYLEKAKELRGHTLDEPEREP